MLTLVPSKDMDTIAVELEGKVIQEDLEKLDKVIEEKFSDKGKFNLYVIVYYYDGASLKAMAEEAKIDLNRWSQYEKMAVISEDKKLETVTEVSDHLPGIKTKHFSLNEMEDAWDWIKD